MVPAHLFPLLPAQLAPAAAEAILVVWLAALGGAVGSFLNVVIYRLPAGESLVHPGSHCPACRHPIRWYDNVPILSWFVLRGRCRDCGSPISMRYPLVEAITAALFVAVGAMEGLSGGANLPLPPVATVGGVVLPPLDSAQSAAIVAYHLLLLCTLLAATLIQHDGNPPPGRLFAPALAVGWVAPLAWPCLHPVSALGTLGVDLPGPATGLVDGTAGLGLGALLGFGLWRAGVEILAELDLGPVAPFWLWCAAGEGRYAGPLWAPACVGLFLGWQAALVLVPGTIVGLVAFALLKRVIRRLPHLPPTAWLALGTVTWIVLWGRIVGCCPLLG